MHKVKKNWVTIGVTALSMVTAAVELCWNNRFRRAKSSNQMVIASESASRNVPHN
ncbi:MAG: KxYKxGKxW signal peptide domain-containing protein [Streptococcus sp.]